MPERRASKDNDRDDSSAESDHDWEDGARTDCEERDEHRRNRADAIEHRVSIRRLFSEAEHGCTSKENRNHNENILPGVEEPPRRIDAVDRRCDEQERNWTAQNANAPSAPDSNHVRDDADTAIQASSNSIEGLCGVRGRQATYCRRDGRRAKDEGRTKDQGRTKDEGRRTKDGPRTKNQAPRTKLPGDDADRSVAGLHRQSLAAVADPAPHMAAVPLLVGIQHRHAGRRDRAVAGMRLDVRIELIR